MNKPKTISILGIEYKIKYKRASRMDGCDGSAHFSDREIHILSSLKGEQLKSTLLHEAIHVILYSSGISQAFLGEEEQEEAAVLALEHGLAPLVELLCLKSS